MKKYFNTTIIIEITCLLYGFIHNYYFMSQPIMFLAGILVTICSLYLFWQCFTNKELGNQKKYFGLITASIPIIIILGYILFAVLFASSTHY